jgi:hypothetical protein
MAGNGSQGCRGAERGQTCTWDRTVDVPHTAALQSAVQLGQGNEVNRQAEMANPTKRMDSLRHACTITHCSCMQRCRLDGIIRSCRTHTGPAPSETLALHTLHHAFQFLPPNTCHQTMYSVRMHGACHMHLWTAYQVGVLRTQTAVRALAKWRIRGTEPLHVKPELVSE